MNVPDRLRLPLVFDTPALVAEVNALPETAWVPHFNTAIFEGDWSGVALRSVGGEPGKLYPDPTATGEFADTAILERCPNLRRSVAQLRCPLTAVRLLTLGPGAAIKQHKDHRLGYQDGEVRLHVPVLTNPLVEFFLDDRPVELRAGECWYLNLSRPHRAVNHSTLRRVHLVLDCIVNAWLATILSDAAAAERQMG